MGGGNKNPHQPTDAGWSWRAHHAPHSYACKWVHSVKKAVPYLAGVVVHHEAQTGVLVLGVGRGQVLVLQGSTENNRSSAEHEDTSTRHTSVHTGECTLARTKAEGQQRV